MKIDDFIVNAVTSHVTEVDLIAAFGSSPAGERDALSDADYFALLAEPSPVKLRAIARVRDEAKRRFGHEVDIHVYPTVEFVTARDGGPSFAFFNGWAVYAVIHGHEPVLYCRDQALIDGEVPRSVISRGAVDRASYYLNRVRELFLQTRMIVRGVQKTPEHAEFVKIATSGLKCVLMFLLANRGVFAHTRVDIVAESARLWDVSTIVEALSARQSCSVDAIEQAYTAVSRIYTHEMSCQEVRS